MRFLITILWVGSAFTASVRGQEGGPAGPNRSGEDKLEFHSCTAQIAAGAAGSSGDHSDYLKKPGTALQAGGGFALTPRFALIFDYMYHQFSVAQQGLAASTDNPTAGRVRAQDVMFEPTGIVHAAHSWNVYLLGGAGWLRHSVKYTIPDQTLSSPGNSRVGGGNTNSGAFDAGLGVNLRINKQGLRCFGEIRYLHGLAANSSIALYSVTGGLRW